MTPIAIVGIGCRLPGGIRDLDGLWAALTAGRDLVTRMPPDRFDPERFVASDPARPGKTYTCAGGFLDDIAGFDAAYFGISPREAGAMDPQQRLMLELAVEALDDAGADPAALAGSATGVYVGASTHDYEIMQVSDPAGIDAYTNAGTSPGNIANRVSHALDLHGPSMTIDTACSSALVAFHQAVHYVRGGAGRTALAGGVNILISPYPYVGFAKASMLSPRGRCHAFSALADGYVRSEGGGFLLLKNLPEALADGDRVHAVVLGTGVNADGRTAGLTLPNPRAQERLLREVYGEAGVDADELVYFEAHGTGTPAGDPVECEAVGRALGRRRSRVLPIGSVKTNLGHLEAAAGVAGLLKAVLVLRHGVIPASLHGDPPNPHIDFAGLRLLPVTAPRPVREGDGRRAAGVNSFGFGGANAHAVLAAPPAPPSRSAPPYRRLPVMVSAQSGPALAEAARRLAGHLPGASAEEFYDLAYTSCRRRGRRARRAVVVAGSPAEAAERLARVAAGDPAGGAAGGASAGGGVAFVFSGNGSQWAGMGADLLRADPVFRAAVEAVDAALSPRLGWSVAEELAASPERSRLALTEVAQPALFAVQVALLETLRERGVRPHAAAGHSVGEIAAAYAAGILDLDQAARVVTERSSAQAPAAGLGRMAAAGLSPGEAGELLARYGGRLEMAAANSAGDVTVSGDPAALAALGEELAARDVFFRPLDLGYAFHSAAMDGAEKSVRAGLDGLRTAAARIPFVSTVTGREPQGELDAGYWWRNVRDPVLFAPAIGHLKERGFDLFVEIGPHPVLTGYLSRMGVTAVATLRRGGDGPSAVESTVAALVAADARLEWERFFPRPGRVAGLPAYPWQRERRWHGGAHVWARPLDHPLLGERVPLMEAAWQGRIEPERLPWLPDHEIDGAVIMPGAAYIEMALAAGRRALGGPVEVTALRFPAGMVLSDSGPVRQTQVTLSDEDGLFRIASRSGPEDEWRVHARGRVRRLYGDAPGRVDLKAVRAGATRRRDHESCYAELAGVGFAYGPSFRVLRELWTGPREALASYVLNVSQTGYEAHPTLLDGALHTVIPLLIGRGHGYLPIAVGTVRAWRTPPPWGFAHTRLTYVSEREAEFDVTITDDTGAAAVLIEGCRVRRLPRAARTPIAGYVTELRPASRTGAAVRPAPWPASCHPTAPKPPPAGDLGLSPADGSDAFGAALADLTAHFTARAFARLLPGATVFDLPALHAAGVLPRHARLVEALASITEARGLLTRGRVPGHDPEDGSGHRDRADAGWRPGAEPAPEALFRALLREHPGHSAELILHGRCGHHLDRVLTGRLDPADLVFPEGGGHTVEHLLDAAPGRRHDARIAQAVLREIVRTWPRDRPLRVLEVGGGTGGMTAALLPVLPPGRTEYVFTDPSEAFLRRAAARFAPYGFVEYRVLDLAREPAGQGFGGEFHDLVVADGALHTVPDVRAAVRRAGDLLVPGGHLLAVEQHDGDRLVPVFGLFERWWSSTDTDLRTTGPLLTAAQWETVLREGGFGEVTRPGPADRPADGSADGSADDPRRTGSSVLLGRRTGNTETGNAKAGDTGSEGTGTATRAGDTAAPPGALPAAAGTSWILVPERGGDDAFAREVTSALRSAGATPAVLAATVTDVSGWPAAMREGDTAAGIVVMLDGGQGGDAVMPDGEPYDDVMTAGDGPDDDVAVLNDATTVPGGGAEAVTGLAVRRAQVLRAVAAARGPLPAEVAVRLWVVTPPTGLHPAPEKPCAPSAAAVWGLTRSLANERPDLEIRRVSFERGDDPGADARRLLPELLEPSAEDEVVLTGGGRFVPRVRPARPVTRSRHAAAGEPFRLRLDGQGPGYRLAWEETGPPPEPGPHEIVVAVRAAGLNYRDVLWARGLLPEEAVQDTYLGPHLGIECAGVVSALGPGVTKFRLGDGVFVAAGGSLASHIVAREGLAGRMPPGMGFTDAATLSIACLSAHYALDHLARLGPGETLLVHGAAGGVGLAALRHAGHVGARVVATAGTPEKRDLLRLLGVPHVVDSRNPAFADRIRALTGGVDVVLNSLAGEAVPRGLELLRGGGRFVELGKLDLYGDRSVSLRPFRDSLSMYALNLDLGPLLEPELWADQVTRVTGLVHRGDYRPIPNRVYPAARVAEAFRLLQHSRHIGKVVVSFDEPFPVEERPGPVRLDPEGTYLVTGGLGGLGAAAAVRLAEHGARHLALVSRAGPDAPGAAAAVRAVRERGATATPYAADVADPAAMRAVLDSVERTDHPLRGVVHAAMVLDDAPLADLSPERFRSALTPKMTGALVLDRLTRDRGLDLFVLLSSLTAVIGNAAQSNYAAANAFLEALARSRRRDGLPGLALGLGVVGGTGYLSRNPELMSFLARLLPPLTPDEALDALHDAVARGAEVAAAGRVTWEQVADHLPAVGVPRLAEVLPAVSQSQDAPDDSLRDLIARGSPHERQGLIAAAIAELVAGILHTASDRLERDRPLARLGLDSLMATEVTAAIRRRFGCAIPALEVIGANGIDHLARLVRTELDRTP
ncbi:type I polyketide synthase [Planobispora takensis]|uniref:Polyketide synthase n=1 Tax=Planobispora takensis TaxID=1367882 RepID=A0A8J3T2G6_9ACTN|nr:type I polyketide synthase [Planobispora takensis]GII04041.1 polyketide synthase [Planobispora takensis]